MFFLGHSVHVSRFSVHCRRTTADVGVAAVANFQQTRYRTEFAAPSRGFPAIAWLSCEICC